MKYLLTYLLLSVSLLAQTTIKPLTQENIEAAITDKPGFVAEIGAGGTVDNAAVVAAIEEDPATIRDAANMPFIDASEYGVVYTASDDVTAAANSTALAAAFSAASTTGATLVVSGTVYTKGENLIAGAGIRVIGENNAAIIQKDTAHNGLTYSIANPPFGLRISGLNITGQGAASHLASGIYARKEWEVTFSAVPAAGGTITIRNTVYTFVSGTPSANQIEVGSSAADQANKMVTALAGNADVSAGAVGTSVILTPLNYAVWDVTENATNTTALIPWITSNYKFRDMTISGFQAGIRAAKAVKLETDNVSISEVQYGYDLFSTDTGGLIGPKIMNAAGGSGADDRACFRLRGSGFGSLYCIGGEFGGTGFGKFAIMTGGAQLYVSYSNFEGFTSNQVVTMSGGNFSLRYSRLGFVLADPKSFISAEVAAAASNPSIEWVENAASSVARPIEIWSSVALTRGINYVTGSPVTVVFAASAGGVATDTRKVSGIARNYAFGTVNLPGDGNATAGEIWGLRSIAGVATDDWADDYLIRRKNNHTGTREWSSISNNMLLRVIGVSGRTASGNNVETDIQNVTLPIGSLRNNGESIDIELFGNTAANTNNKHFRFYFGGSLYLDFGALPINAESWTIKIRIQRGSFAGGTGYMKIVGTLDYGSGRVIKTAETPSAAIDSTATIATRVTVLTPTAASDAVSLAAKTTWLRAVPGI